MEKKIKVWLQYPWKFPDSPYYKYLIDSSPEGIEFLNTKKQKGAITNKKFFWFSNFLKRNIRRFFNFFNLSFPNAHKSPKRDYDLIQCCHCLSKNKDKPWVADIECEWQLYIGKKTKKAKDKIKEILLRRNCKKIMPWTEATANEIIKEFPEIKNKVKIVYPAISILKHKKIKHKGTNLLFVARYFYAKGGLETLEAFDYLTKKYNIQAIFVSEIPKKILERYEKNEKIKFYNVMEQNKLFKEIYPKTDIFVYPGYSDSFGFSLIEAASFSLPIITVDGFARKEIVQNGKNGFVVQRPKINWERGIPIIKEKDRKQLIENIIKKTEILIKNKNLREKMGKEGYKLVKEGKFSIKERNKKLRRIYEEALR